MKAARLVEEKQKKYSVTIRKEYHGLCLNRNLKSKVSPCADPIFVDL